MEMKTTYFFTILTLIGIVCTSNAQSLNTFSGDNAGTNNTGNFNSGFGINSLKNNTSHSNNAFGFGTLMAASGGFNCAFGNEALSLNTTGNLNAAFGTQSLVNNTTGSKNIAIGHRTMEANTNGSSNTSIGYASLLTSNGNNNVAIGYTSGRHLLSGDSNVFLGAETGINLLNGSNNVLLGNRIALNRAPSTLLLAGNDTYKSVIISDGSGVQRIFINRNGNTGIGLGDNVIPINKLDVKGGVAIGKNFTPNGIAPIVSAPVNGLAVEGRLGIGTLAPNNKVEITQGTNGNSGLRFTNLTSSFVPTSAQSSNNFLSVNATGDVVLQKMSNVVQSNILSSAGNVMTSNVNGISSSTKIVNSIANSINESNQLITTVNGVSSAPVNLPSPNMEEIDGSVTNELQTLSQSENTITLSNGGGSFVLPTFTQVPQVISQSGNTVSLSNGGGSFTFPTFTDTDAQSLALTGNVLSISNGNSVTLPTYVDVPQVISQSGNTISLSNGGGSFTFPTTSVVAGTNVTVTGNGSAATPFLINATDKSIFSDNGTINQATTISGNRVVNMNNRNIWFSSASTDANGKIYIGSTATYPTTTGNYKLFVEGGILTEKVKVALRSTANWADYVFENDYKLMPLNKVEEFITANKHLPGIDSAADLATNGLDIAEMQAKHMAKIEELTLYIIEQNKAIERNAKAIEELKKQVQVLTANQD